MQQQEKKSILIVDDEEIIREFLYEVLNENFEISIACDGQEAIEKLKKRKFDLIITDLKIRQAVRSRQQGNRNIRLFESLYSQSVSKQRRMCFSVQTVQHKRTGADSKQLHGIKVTKTWLTY